MLSNSVVIALLITVLCGKASASPPRTRLQDVGPGRAVWFDIRATNLDEAKLFYNKLFEWDYRPVDGTSREVEIVARGVSIGAIKLERGTARRLNGAVYIQVDDIRASCSKARKLGATVLKGYPRSLPDRSGAVALIASPSGYPIGLISRRPLEYPGTLDDEVFIPDQGCVPNAVTAIKIAEAAWEPVYGKATIDKERPFEAMLDGEVWHVFGGRPSSTAPEPPRDVRGYGASEPPPAEEPKTGSLELKIRKRDGQILWLNHSH